MKEATWRVRSNRIHRVQSGGYTSVYEKEAEAEAKRKQNMIRQGFMQGGRRW
jgi:hypothetical protein